MHISFSSSITKNSNMCIVPIYFFKPVKCIWPPLPHLQIENKHNYLNIVHQNSKYKVSVQIQRNFNVFKIKVLLNLQDNICYLKVQQNIKRLSNEGKIHVFNLYKIPAAAVVQWVRGFASQAEGWEIEFQPRQTQVVKTGSGSFIAKRSALGVSVTGPRRWPL